MYRSKGLEGFIVKGATIQQLHSLTTTTAHDTKTSATGQAEDSSPDLPKEQVPPKRFLRGNPSQE